MISSIKDFIFNEISTLLYCVAAAIEPKTVAAFKSQLVEQVHQPFPPSSLILQKGGAAEVPIQSSKIESHFTQ